MGKVWMPGGGGGSDLDAVTAGKPDVLAGKVFVDKDGEPQVGAMPDLTGNSTIEHAVNNMTKVIVGDAVYISKNTDNVTRVEIRYNGNAGYVRPNTLFAIDQTKVATASGLTPNKLLSGNAIMGVDGGVPVYGGTYWNTALDVGAEADNLYSFFPVGYYGAFDSRGSLHRIPIQRVRDATGVSANKIIEGQSIAGVWGSVKDYSYLANGQTAF